MSEIKIAHMSDMHLGSPFSGLPYEKSKLRCEEVIYSAVKAIKDCSDCDVLLLSGDIFDSGNCLFSVADALLSAINSIHNTRVFYSCGNHDNYNTEVVRYCVDNAPDNLYIFPPDKISYITIEDLNTRVYGVSFADEYQCDSLFDTMPECDENYINLLCMHADFSSAVYNPINFHQLEDTKLHYVALGHIHSFSGIKYIGKTAYSYPGITEGRGFDECGEKGYIKGHISKTHIELKFFSNSKRKYIEETIDISDFKSEYDLIDIMNSICENENNVCRFTFVGTNTIGKPLDLNMLSLQCIAFHCVCTDNTKFYVSIDDYIDYPGLIGECARETKKRMFSANNPDEQELIIKSFKILINMFENK